MSLSLASDAVQAQISLLPTQTVSPAKVNHSPARTVKLNLENMKNLYKQGFFTGMKLVKIDPNSHQAALSRDDLHL